VTQNGRRRVEFFFFLRRLNFGCTDVIPATDYLVNAVQPGDIWPDLLITVNFTTLGINATSLSNSASRTVLIAVGMHGDTADVLRNTLPIALIPDAHLLGGVLTNIRYQYRSPKFGILSSVRPLAHIFSPTASLLHTRQRSI